MDSVQQADIPLDSLDHATLVEEGLTVRKSVSEAESSRDGLAHTIPDGGLRAWCSVAGSFLVLLCTFGYLNAFGVYQTYYVEVLLPSYSPSDISWIGSLQLGLIFGMGLICGKLFDARIFHKVLLFGSVLYVGCIFALSAAPQDAYYAVFLSQGIGQGIAQGLLYLPSLALMSHHFRKRRAMAMGIVLSGSSLGGIIFPIMLNNIFKSSGFAAGVRASGYLILGCLAAANLLVSTHYDPGHKTAPKPSMAKFLTDLPYVLTLVGSFFALWGLWMIFFFIQLYATVHGISETLSFYTITILNAGSAFGRIIPNVIADRAGPFALLAPCMFACAILFFAFFGVQSSGAIIIFCILYGFFSGAVFSLYSPLVATLSNDISEFGTRLGLAFLVCGLASLTGLPITGALIGDNGPEYTWWKATLFSGIMVLVGVSFTAWAAVLQSRRKGTVWV